MPFRIFLLIVLIGALISYSCAPKNSKRMEYSTLKVIIDTNANFYLDSINVSTKYNNYTIERIIIDEALNNQLVYVLDSIEKGEAKLLLTSFLDRTFAKEINIDRDSVVFIKASELNNFQNAERKTMPSFDLKDRDTIVIGLKSIGCFHFYNENVIISKDNGKYNVAFNNTRLRGYGLGNMNIKREFDQYFQDTLNMFSAECKKLFKRNYECWSTNNAFIYIRQGNSIYSLPDIGCEDDWQAYNRLIAALNPPWPKTEK